VPAKLMAGVLHGSTGGQLFGELTVMLFVQLPLKAVIVKLVLVGTVITLPDTVPELTVTVALVGYTLYITE
jgi:hypothetical protein